MIDNEDPDPRYWTREKQKAHGFTPKPSTADQKADDDAITAEAGTADTGAD